MKDIIPTLLKEIHKKVVGEDIAIKTIILTKALELVENKDPTSANLMVNANSGSGKDFVTRNTLAIFPNETTISRTNITPNVLTYWEPPGGTWNGKSLYLEDIKEDVLNSPVFKTMASGRSSATVTIKQKAVDIDIDGKPSMFITTAAAEPNPELLRRFPIVKLTETKEQTKAIKKRQAKSAKGSWKVSYDSAVTKFLSTLDIYSVDIPFAEELDEHFPDEHLIMRTNFPRFLDYIKASTALHQHNREKNADGSLIATGDDYSLARETILATSTNDQMIPISTNKEKILDVWHSGNLMYNEPYPVREILPFITHCTQKALYDNLDSLAENKLLRKGTSLDSQTNKDVIAYTCSKPLALQLPDWKNLCKIMKKKNSSEGEITIPTIPTISTITTIPTIPFVGVPVSVDIDVTNPTKPTKPQISEQMVIEEELVKDE